MADNSPRSNGNDDVHVAARAELRNRWELASVLNFFHVFEPLIESDLKISGEDFESALISSNDDLGRIHLALLKGLTSKNKKMEEPDAWITYVCKKLEQWWTLVAEGENPLKPNRGEEITRYKELDPTTRLLILKALCEVRAEQDDILRYITDKLKEGTKITDFRKEKIGGNKGVSYWYDGDPVIGHRLYREVSIVDVKPQKLKSKGKFPAFNCTWETLATNLVEFQQIPEKLSCSLAREDAAVGKMIKTEILPLLEDLQKKKERALKRKERKAMLFNNVQDARVGNTRLCRERKPVCYTFEDFDRSISEAIQMTKRGNTKGKHMGNDSLAEPAFQSEDADRDDLVPQTNVSSLEKPEESISDDSEFEDKEDQYNNDDSDDDYDYDYDRDSENSKHDLPLAGCDNKENILPGKKHSVPQENGKNNRKVVIAVRRSTRNAVNNTNAAAGECTRESLDASMEVQLMQRPNCDTNYAATCVISDSEDDTVTSA